MAQGHHEIFIVTLSSELLVCSFLEDVTLEFVIMF